MAYKWGGGGGGGWGGRLLSGSFAGFFFSISLIVKLDKSLPVAFFKFLDHIMVFLFVLITFEPILDGFF